MEAIKFDRVVSVNSELQGHGAQNILSGEISPNKNWTCEKGTEKAVVILQLERAVVLTSIHIGNAHSAFVEVLVGKAADSNDQFESLIPMSVFMNPHESKTGTNPNRTRFFNKSDFDESAATKTWDRIKVVCSQPFNKHVPYGLCFLKVHGEKKAEVRGKAEGNAEEIEIGSFFKKKRNSGRDKQLTISEQIKEAEKSEHAPISITKFGEKFSEKKAKPGSDEGKQKRREKITEKTPKRKRDEENAVKKEQTAKKRKEEKTPKREKKPFEKLFEDVVLVISGFQNPLRANIRNMALEMGAEYSGNWQPHCTHLVCAFVNTAKFQQVKGKGKIVKKEWVEKCHKDRRRYPWRRFALDRTDQMKPESEEEIDADEPEPEVQVEVAGSSKTESEGPEAAEGSSSSEPKSASDDYDTATDDEEEQTLDTTDYPMPFLPDIFSLKRFYVDPNLRSRAQLERYIIAYNGVLVETFNKDVEYYITETGGVPLELFREAAPLLVAIKPSWIWEINAEQKFVPVTRHLVK